MRIGKILRLYAILREVTPLPVDCGELCEASCCHGEAEDGMWLLPGEEKIARVVPGFTCRKLPEGRNYVTCRGKCPRNLRPFMCRIYPLVPLLTEERSGENAEYRLRVVADPRAMACCPLLKAEDYIEGRFVASVRRAGKLLAEDPEGREFLLALAEELKAYRRFFGENYPGRHRN